jgi:DnaK suppressor protein
MTKKSKTTVKAKASTAKPKAKSKTKPSTKSSNLRNKAASFAGEKTSKVASTKKRKETVSKIKRRQEPEVNSKVKEIISKSTQGVSADLPNKKESKAFTLEDVRSILSSKQKTLKSAKEDPVKQEKVKKVSKKKSGAKVKKLSTASIDDILGFGSGVSAVPSKPIRDPEKVPKELVSYYNDLMDLRTSLKGALGQRSNETLGASAREASGELSLNSSDAGTETFDRDVALSMVANEQEALNEIEDAIDRIFDGTFGICQETQKPIKKNRLKAVPFTRFSLEGQDLYEKRKKREGGSSMGTFATIADSTLGVEE